MILLRMLKAVWFFMLFGMEMDGKEIQEMIVLY